MSTITKKQTGTLRGLAAEYLPGGDGVYRSWLRETFPSKDWSDRTSTKELTQAEASRAIKLLLQLKTGTAPKPWRGRYTVTGHKGEGKHLTQAQADEIARLETALGWDDDPSRLRGFIQRQTGATSMVRALTKRQATKVITGLRKMRPSSAA